VAGGTEENVENLQMSGKDLNWIPPEYNSIALPPQLASFGMFHCVALVITDVSEELSTSIIRVTRIGELGTLAITSNRYTLGRTVASYD
jgi:hypothetical protein